MTLFLITMLLLSALALWLRPAQTSRVTHEARPSLRAVRNFLYAYVWTLLIRFSHLMAAVPTRSQIPLLLIRQALATLWFGRGLLHG